MAAAAIKNRKEYSRNDGDLPPRPSFAAWFPYHFANSAAAQIANPTSGLGLASLGMFAITYPDGVAADTALAEIKLNAGIDSMPVLSLHEKHLDWEQKNKKGRQVGEKIVVVHAERHRQQPRAGNRTPRASFR